MEHTMNKPHPYTARLGATPTSLALALVLAGLALAGCASTPVPTTQLALSEAAVAHAAAAGSTELAPAEMAIARDKMNRANQAVAGKDNASALTLAQQAQVDAQLAEAKAESVKAGKSAVALQEAGRALREEMARQPR
jgi:hypothetical protein